MSHSTGDQPMTAPAWCGWEADPAREVLRYPGADLTIRWADLRTPADRIRTMAHLHDHSRDMLRGLENALGALLAGLAGWATAIALAVGTLLLWNAAADRWLR